MKGLSKKIFTSILALILTGAALGTGVFAWFTINNTATANGFEGTVEAASGGFMVSRNGTTWSTSVTLNDLFEGERFSDLTTVDGINIVKKDGTEATGGYVEFNLHFAAFAFTNIEATLDIKGGPSSWIPDYQGSTEEAVTNYASNAVRVSFEQNNEVTVFEKADGTDNNTTGIGTFEDNKAVEYYNKVNPSQKITEAEFGKVNGVDAYVANEDNVHTGEAKVATLGDPSGVTLPEGYTTYAKVTVRVWIEGWDQEAYNAILNGTVNINFTFKAN